MTSVGRCPHCGSLDANRRRDAYTAGFDDGRARGFLEAAQLRREVGVPVELADLWPSLIRLVHPDVHAPVRQEQAHEVTVALLAWRERVGARGGR